MSAASSHPSFHGEAGGDDDSGVSHAQRVREEGERRRRQEQEAREAALEQARREVRVKVRQ